MVAGTWPVKRTFRHGFAIYLTLQR